MMKPLQSGLVVQLSEEQGLFPTFLMTAQGKSKPQVQMFTQAVWAKVVARRRARPKQHANLMRGLLVPADWYPEATELQRGFVLQHDPGNGVWLSHQVQLGWGNSPYVKLFARKPNTKKHQRTFEAKFIIDPMAVVEKLF